MDPLIYMFQNKTKNKRETEVALDRSLEFCLKLVIYRHLLETDYIQGEPQDGEIFGYRATADISEKKMFISFPIIISLIYRTYNNRCDAIIGPRAKRVHM